MPQHIGDDVFDVVRRHKIKALDGREGHVYIKPGPEVESAYRKLQRDADADRELAIYKELKEKQRDKAGMQSTESR